MIAFYVRVLKQTAYAGCSQAIPIYGKAVLEHYVKGSATLSPCIPLEFAGVMSFGKEQQTAQCDS